LVIKFSKTKIKYVSRVKYLIEMKLVNASKNKYKTKTKKKKKNKARGMVIINILGMFYSHEANLFFFFFFF